MSKKQLARTAIEGGRASYNQFERRHSTRKERQDARAFRGLARVMDGDDLPAAPRRQPVHPSFSDKLSPVYRWLDRQVGRRWDDVYAEIRTRFDARTTAGRHILFCHMLRDVDRFGEISLGYWGFDLVVDDRGMLRSAEGYMGRGRHARRPSLYPRRVVRDAAMHAWARERKVGLRGLVAFWFLPVIHDNVTRFRQGHRLSEDDLELWNALVEDQRAQIRITFGPAS